MKQRLFQSTSLEVLIQGVNGLVHARGGLGVVEAWFHAFSRERGGQISASVWGTSSPYACSMRSEEHTSELQSQSNLVCRLLLEKKKISQSRLSRQQYRMTQRPSSKLCM